MIKRNRLRIVTCVYCSSSTRASFCFAPDIPHISPQPGLSINVHLLTLKRHLLNTDIPPNLVLLDNFLVQNRRRALWICITLQLSTLLVRCDVISLKRCLVLGDNGHIDVGTRAQVIEDTRKNSITSQLDGVILRQIRLPLCFEHTHSSQATTAHGDVGQFVGAAMGVDGEQVRACRVTARDNQIRAYMPLVTEQMLLEECHAGDDAGLAACGEGMQLELRRDESRRELRIGGGTGTGAPDLRGDVVQLFAVFVGDDRT